MGNQYEGRQIIAGVKKAATWGTAVALGAGNGILLSSESLGAKAPTFVDDPALGQSQIREMIQTQESMAGGLDGLFRWGSVWEVLLALALGTVSTPTQKSTTSAYAAVYTPKDNNDGAFATVALKKSATTHNIWEVPTAKVSGFTISGEMGGKVKVSVNLAGNKIETQSAVNTGATMANVTYSPTVLQDNIADFGTGTYVRVNTASSSALTSAHNIYPQNFELSFTRPTDHPRFQPGSINAAEPLQDGPIQVKLKLGFDKYDSDTYVDAIVGKTHKKVEIGIVGPAISAYTYKLGILLPSVFFTQADSPVGDMGLIPHTVDAVGLRPDTVSSGMTSAGCGINLLDSLGLYVTNKRTTSPIA